MKFSKNALIALSTINLMIFTIVQVFANYSTILQNILMGYYISAVVVFIVLALAGIFILPFTDSEKPFTKRAKYFFYTLLGYSTSAVVVYMTSVLVTISISIPFLQIGLWAWYGSVGLSGLIDFGYLMAWVFEGM